MGKDFIQDNKIQLKPEDSLKAATTKIRNTCKGFRPGKESDGFVEQKSGIHLEEEVTTLTESLSVMDICKSQEYSEHIQEENERTSSHMFYLDDINDSDILLSVMGRKGNENSMGLNSIENSPCGDLISRDKCSTKSSYESEVRDVKGARKLSCGSEDSEDESEYLPLSERIKQKMSGTSRKEGKLERRDGASVSECGIMGKLTGTCDTAALYTEESTSLSKQTIDKSDGKSLSATNNEHYIESNIPDGSDSTIENKNVKTHESLQSPISSVLGCKVQFTNTKGDMDSPLENGNFRHDTTRSPNCSIDGVNITDFTVMGAMNFTSVSTPKFEDSVNGSRNTGKNSLSCIDSPFSQDDSPSSCMFASNCYSDKPTVRALGDGGISPSSELAECSFSAKSENLESKCHEANLRESCAFSARNLHKRNCASASGSTGSAAVDLRRLVMNVSHGQRTLDGNISSMTGNVTPSNTADNTARSFLLDYGKFNMSSSLLQNLSQQHSCSSVLGGSPDDLKAMKDGVATNRDNCTRENSAEKELIYSEGIGDVRTNSVASNKTDKYTTENSAKIGLNQSKQMSSKHLQCHIEQCRTDTRPQHSDFYELLESPSGSFLLKNGIERKECTPNNQLPSFVNSEVRELSFSPSDVCSPIVSCKSVAASNGTEEIARFVHDLSLTESNTDGDRAMVKSAFTTEQSKNNGEDSLSDSSHTCVKANCSKLVAVNKNETASQLTDEPGKLICKNLTERDNSAISDKPCHSTLAVDKFTFSEDSFISDKFKSFANDPRDDIAQSDLIDLTCDESITNERISTISQSNPSIHGDIAQSNDSISESAADESSVNEASPVGLLDRLRKRMDGTSHSVLLKDIMTQRKVSVKPVK